MAESPDFRRRVFVVMPFGKKEVPKKTSTYLPPDPGAKDEELKVDFNEVYQELFKPALEAAGLQPFRADDDASRINTARFKHYQAQAEEWNQRVIIAGKEGRAEDILTLAGDVPSPYYRRNLLRQCGDALLALGRFAQSEKVFKELCEDLDETGSADEFRAKCQLALLANRLGRAREAEQKLNSLSKQMPGEPQAQGLLGRVYKDMWRTAWSGAPKLEERLALAWRNAALARRSLATYLGGLIEIINPTKLP